MSATLPIPFGIGENVWWIGHGHRTRIVTCPECVGTRVITMIQGNGIKVTLDCACCRRGYEPSTGQISETYFEYAPTPFRCEKVSVRGDDIDYRGDAGDGHDETYAEAKNLFRNFDECAARCAKLNEEQKKYADEQALAILQSKRRDMTWSVHYWGRQIKDLERQLERVRARLDAARERKP